MDAHQLLKAGRLNDAIKALQQHLSAAPSDLKARTFLFELTCFTGEFSHAQQLLHHLEAAHRPESHAGVSFYSWVLDAEQKRQRMFLDQKQAQHMGVEGDSYAGSLNGRDFLTFSDTDFRIGENLEILWQSDYFLVPLSAVRRLQVPPPRRLRDLLWLPAELTYRAQPDAETREDGVECIDVVLPMMCPLTWQHPDEEVRIGRSADWRENQFGQVVPFGLKSYLADDHHLPIAEIRDLRIKPIATAS